MSNHEQMFPGDLVKTAQARQLLQMPRQQRDAQWLEDFLQAIPFAILGYRDPQVIQGPDGFPYFQLFVLQPDQNTETATLDELVKEFLIEEGLGVVINPRGEEADWVFAYGDIVNYFINNTFSIPENNFSRGGEENTITADMQLLVGDATENTLPPAVRKVLREYLVNVGITEPKVAVIIKMISERQTMDLVFNITQEVFESEADFSNFMQSIGWFLPQHYSYLAIGENELARFFPL